MADMQKRIWAYCDLPIPADEIGSMKHWRMIGGDPVALLEEAIPFIGWGSAPEGLLDRCQAIVDAAGGDRG